MSDSSDDPQSPPAEGPLDAAALKRLLLKQRAARDAEPRRVKAVRPPPGAEEIGVEELKELLSSADFEHPKIESEEDGRVTVRTWEFSSEGVSPDELKGLLSSGRAKIEASVTVSSERRSKPIKDEQLVELLDTMLESDPERFAELMSVGAVQRSRPHYLRWAFFVLLILGVAWWLS